MRLMVFRLMLGVAIAAIVFYLAFDWLGSRRERLQQIAKGHAHVGAEYQRNGRRNAGMVRIAAWHDHMRRQFERAAAWRWAPSPTSRVLRRPDGARRLLTRMV